MSDAYVQDHIHLAETLQGSGEKAPIYQWTASDRKPVVVFDAEVSRSLTGVPYAHVVKRAGVPVLHFDYTYTLRLIGDADLGVAGSSTVWDYVDRLNDLAGKHLYLVDHRHCIDGLDHTAFVRPVLLGKIGDYNVDHALLRYFYIQIYLNDMTIPA